MESHATEGLKRTKRKDGSIGSHSIVVGKCCRRTLFESSVASGGSFQPEFGAYRGLARVLKSPSNSQNCRNMQKILEKGAFISAPIPGMHQIPVQKRSECFRGFPSRGVQVLRSKRLILLHERRAWRTANMK